MELLILGGGQLALMLCWAVQRLPTVIKYVDAESAPASRCAELAVDPYAEIENSDVVTFEFENVDFDLATYAEKLGKLKPKLDYLRIKRSRIWEREFFKSLGVPTVRWRVANGGFEALEIAREWGKAVVKIPTGGYDGRGQYIYPRESELIERLTGSLLVEEYVNIEREFSIVAVRGEDGDVYFYPPAQNYYVDGILVWNIAPVDAPPEAYDYVYKILEWGKYVGIIAVEFFQTKNGVLINEIAPRVHNTGHWTLETDASQFENHVRAVLGLPIKEPKVLKPTAMVNILGRRFDELPVGELEKVGKIYWYNKTEVKPRRKMGHVNIVGNTSREVFEEVRKTLTLIYGREFARLVLKHTTTRQSENSRNFPQSAHSSVSNAGGNRQIA